MGFVVIPVGIGGLGDVDVGSFSQGVLAGVCASDIYIQGIAAVATGDDDGLLCELTERLQDSFAELSSRTGMNCEGTVLSCGWQLQKRFFRIRLL